MTSFCGSDNDENDYEIGYREGMAARGGLIGMFTAIKERPVYNFKAITYFGSKGNHSVSWHPTEKDARLFAEKSYRNGDPAYKIVKEHIERCSYCDDTVDITI